MKLRELIKNTLNLDEGETFSDLDGPDEIPGWDSLGHVNIMAELESTYNISIGMSEVIAIETVQDIAEMLEEKGVECF